MAFSYRGKQLPEHLEESLTAYVESGRPTGDFLEACINNRLSLACALADEENVWIIPVISAWLYNEAPAGCWGREDSSTFWIERKHAERREQGVL